MNRAKLFLGFISVAIPATCSAPRALAQDKIEYNRDIRPILAENCFACHGPDSASRKAKLRLDQRDAAIQAGVIVPGDPGKSEIIRRTCSDDVQEIMPPAKTLQKLSASQNELLK